MIANNKNNEKTKIKRKLIFLEDNYILRNGLKKGLEKIFYEDFQKQPSFQQYLPDEIISFENLEDFLEQSEPEEDTFYNWITDWHFEDRNTANKNYIATSAAIYTSLAIILGGYETAHIARQILNADPFSFLIKEYFDLKEQIGIDKIKKMNQYIKNSGSFFIHTAFPADAIFRADVEVAFDSASHTNAPLVLYQEKSNNNQETDIYNMALATVIVAKAYQGQLPLIGKPAKIDETRCSLDKSIAEKYSVAKQLSDNQIQSFLEEFPIGQIF